MLTSITHCSLDTTRTTASLPTSVCLLAERVKSNDQLKYMQDVEEVRYFRRINTTGITIYVHTLVVT